jgi:hypothetical protein
MNLKEKSNENPEDKINIDNNKNEEGLDLLNSGDMDQANISDDNIIFNNIDFTYKDFKEWHKYNSKPNNDNNKNNDIEDLLNIGDMDQANTFDDNNNNIIVNLIIIIIMKII